MRPHRLAHDVVGRGQGKALLPGGQHRRVAEGGGGIDGQAAVPGQLGEAALLGQVLGQGVGLLPVDAPAVMAEHLALGKARLLNGGQVHAEAYLPLFQFDAHARRLQGRAAGIDLGGIVAQQGEEGGVAARGQLGGTGPKPAQLASAYDLKALGV